MKLTLPIAGAAAIVLVSSTAAMLTPREPECRLVHEPSSARESGRSLNRDHVAQDFEAIRREADRFAKAVAARPLASDSIDARAGARTAPARAAAWCRATLVADLAIVHQTSEAALRAAVSDSEDQAETDRTSRADGASAVVSRPSR